MPITDAQRTKLEAIAKERGLDFDQLVAEAEKIIAERESAPALPPPPMPPKPEPPANATSRAAAPAAPEQPKLFQYHLPFVTVNEVRTKWLGLEAWSDEDGGSENAGAFAASHGAASAPAPSPTSTNPSAVEVAATPTNHPVDGIVQP